MKTKVIFVIGGVYSSLGKGIIASSIGKILAEMKNSVSMLKCDPYLNVNPGNLSPYQHGEVFVTADGAEADLDLGNYERFVGKGMTKMSTITSGKIYSEIIAKERAGGFEGKTVQVVPHVTNLIKAKINELIEIEKPDFLIIEVGGTVGDLESIPFIEALSQFTSEHGRENVLAVLCAPLIHIDTTDEVKTKPAQHAFKELARMGIVPQMMILRTTCPVSHSIVEKIGLTCYLDVNNLFLSPNLPNIYFLPCELYNQGIHKSIYKHFDLPLKSDQNINNWVKYTDNIKKIKEKVRIAIVGKYIELKDSYASLIEALKLGAWENGKNVELSWIQSENITAKNVKTTFKGIDGILVPGGFGNRGIPGKIETIKYARTNNIPFMGICLGMQVACIEFARNVLKIKDANSTEFEPKTANPLFDFIDGRMRLGEQECKIVDKKSNTYKLYGTTTIKERHRHRYEFNAQYIKEFEKAGFSFTAFSNDKEKTVEIIEIKKHPFFMAGQFHPELSSWPGKVDPMFLGFLKAAIKRRKK